MARDRDEEQGVSLRRKDRVAGGGGFGPGPATLTRARFEMFEYTPKAGSKKKVVRAPVLLVKFEREGVDEAREPYGVGAGWGVTKDGLKLVAKNGQPGLPDGCNADHFLNSFEDNAGMPEDWLDTPDQLDGLEVVLELKPIERTFDDGTTKKKSLLVIAEVIDPPWESKGGGKSKGASKSKKKDDSDDDGEDEKPRHKNRASKDDDEEPAKGKSAKGGKGAKGGDDDAEAIDEEAIEILIEALADGPLKQADIEDDLRGRLKGNPQKNVIAARASEDDFLELEKGWTFDAKKGRVSLD